MAADDITVTYLLPGSLFPREFEAKFRGDAPNELIAKYGPAECFAYRRSDKQKKIYYIDGTVYTLFELSKMGKHTLARNIGSSFASNAVLCRDGKWQLFFCNDRTISTTNR